MSDDGTRPKNVLYSEWQEDEVFLTATTQQITEDSEQFTQVLVDIPMFLTPIDWALLVREK